MNELLKMVEKLSKKNVPYTGIHQWIYSVYCESHSSLTQDITSFPKEVESTSHLQLVNKNDNGVEEIM